MFSKGFDTLQKGVNYFTGFLLALLCATIFIQVFLRYVLSLGISWSEEIMRYFQVWIIYLGINFGIRDGEEIKIDVLDVLLSGKAKTRNALHFFHYTCSLIAAVAAMISSLYLIRMGFLSTTPTLRWPMWVPYLALPIGFTFNIVELIRRMVYTFQDGIKQKGGV